MQTDRSAVVQKQLSLPDSVFLHPEISVFKQRQKPESTNNNDYKSVQKQMSLPDSVFCNLNQKKNISVFMQRRK